MTELDQLYKLERHDFYDFHDRLIRQQANEYRHFWTALFLVGVLMIIILLQAVIIFQTRDQLHALQTQVAPLVITRVPQ